MHKRTIPPARHFNFSQSCLLVACSHLQLIYNQMVFWSSLFVSCGSSCWFVDCMLVLLFRAPISVTKGPGKRGHIVADTLLPTQMFPRLPARATFVAGANFVSGTQKMFLILFRNILCPQQMFLSVRSPRNIISNNVSATMCPRLPGP